MPVRVLFFGATADIAGTRETNVAGQHGTTTRQLLVHILEQHPHLASHKLLFSVNQQYGAGDEILRDGDEVAIFTAVSGG